MAPAIGTALAIILVPRQAGTYASHAAHTYMAKKATVISAAVRKAVDKVLSQQKGTKYWDGGSHIACIVYLSDLCGSNKEFAEELAKHGWLCYASNTKKELESAGLIPASGHKASEYSF